MNNPWLEIDISDYVNHMSSPEVGQYQLINQSFRTILQKRKPGSIFVPGCTIGNGFEHIEWQNVERVTALDINPDFLNILKSKFRNEEKLEIICMDFNTFICDERQYDLIFSALFFEYVDIHSVLKKFREMMNKSSVLFSIIQLPGLNQSKVSKSNYISLNKLSPYISLTTPEEFIGEIKKAGLQIKRSTNKTLSNGKTFFLSESVLK